MMRIWPLCERKNTVFALSRWYTLAAQPSSLLLKSPEIFSQSASSQNLTDEMACHINVAAADNLFFLLYLRRHIWILYLGKGSLRAWQGADARKWVKIYDSLPSKWSSTLEWKYHQYLLPKLPTGQETKPTARTLRTCLCYFFKFAALIFSLKTYTRSLEQI